MRIVQSIKHTKKNNNLKIIKEGWLVHYTNKDNIVCFYIYILYLFLVINIYSTAKKSFLEIRLKSHHII